MGIAPLVRRLRLIYLAHPFILILLGVTQFERLYTVHRALLLEGLTEGRGQQIRNLRMPIGHLKVAVAEPVAVLIILTPITLVLLVEQELPCC